MGQSEIYPEPSAPPQPQDQYQETHQQSQRQAQGNPPVNFPDENHTGRDHQESSSKHVFYSIELLVFAFVHKCKYKKLNGIKHVLGAAFLMISASVVFIWEIDRRIALCLPL